MPPFDWLKAAEKLLEWQHIFLFINFLHVKFYMAFENRAKDATGLSLSYASGGFTGTGVNALIALQEKPPANYKQNQEF